MIQHITIASIRRRANNTHKIVIAILVSGHGAAATGIIDKYYQNINE